MKQTLEEAAHKMLDDYGIKSMGQSIGVLEVKKLMVKMAKWQAERSYSELFQWLASKDYLSDELLIIQKEFEQFKNK